MRPARRYRLELSYDGTDYAGWQYQPGARTVQGTVEEVLSTLQGRGKVSVRGAGRTDAGVHARGQVADFLLDSRLDEAGVAHALRSMLPVDIRPLSVRAVGESFHARKDARAKTYRYRIDRSRAGDPFLARYSLHDPRRLDLATLGKALRRLPGRRDWSGFAGSACSVKDRVRNLVEARYDDEPGERGWFTFTADGFLNHMVRILVGTVLEIARGRFSPDRIDEVIRSGDRSLAGPTAPARGLFLWRVEYPASRLAKET